MASTRRRANPWPALMLALLAVVAVAVGWAAWRTLDGPVVDEAGPLISLEAPQPRLPESPSLPDLPTPVR